MLRDQPPERIHELSVLVEKEEPLPSELLELQVYAVEARSEEGPFYSEDA